MSPSTQSRWDPPVLRVVLRPSTEGKVAGDAIDGFATEHIPCAPDRAAVVAAVTDIVRLLLDRSCAGDAVEIVMDVGPHDVQVTGSTRCGAHGVGDADVWFSVPTPG